MDLSLEVRWVDRTIRHFYSSIPEGIYARPKEAGSVIFKPWKIMTRLIIDHLDYAFREFDTTRTANVTSIKQNRVLYLPAG